MTVSGSFFNANFESINLNNADLFRMRELRQDILLNNPSTSYFNEHKAADSNFPCRYSPIRADSLLVEPV